jgi:ABC-2 type transport system permease protein
VAIVVLTAATSAVAGGMPAIVGRSGDAIAELFDRYSAHPDAAISDVFIWMVLYSCAAFGTLYPLLTVLRIRKEEIDGRAELLLAHPVTRSRWALAHLGTALIGSAALMILAGATSGLVYGLSIGRLTETWPRVLLAAVLLIPAIWITGSIAALAVGLVPRAAAVIAWVAFLFVNAFGESVGPALGLAYAVADRFVPFHYVPKVITGAQLEVGPLMIIVALTAALGAAGVLALRQRDLR